MTNEYESIDNRLQLIKILDESEKRKYEFEKQLKAIQSTYLDEVSITFNNCILEDELDDCEDGIQTTEKAIVCDKNILRPYIELEIKRLSKLSKSVLEQIQEL